MSKDPVAERAAWHICVVLAAVALTMVHIGSTTAYVPLEDLARFRAFEPFQHRLLVPALVAGLRPLAPAAPALVWYALIEITGWILLFNLAAAALRAFAVPCSARAIRLAALTVAWPVGLHLIKPQAFELIRPDGTLCRVQEGDLGFARIALAPNLYYPYDLPAAVFVLLVIVLVQRAVRNGRPVWLSLATVAVAAAALNRESAVLLALATAALVAPRGGRPAWRVVVTQAALALAVAWLAQLAVGPWAAPNPHASLAASAYEFTLLNNLRSLAHPFYFVMAALPFAGGLYLALWWYRRHLDPAMTRLLVFFVVPAAALALALGQVLESRVFVEVQPVIWLATVQALAAAAAAGADPR